MVFWRAKLLLYTLFYWFWCSIFRRFFVGLFFGFISRSFMAISDCGLLGGVWFSSRSRKRVVGGDYIMAILRVIGV